MRTAKQGMAAWAAEVAHDQSAIADARKAVVSVHDRLGISDRQAAELHAVLDAEQARVLDRLAARA
jgi:hypothetical protein